jgi:membrane protein
MKEGLSVKYIVTIIWGLILSQATYYLGSALSQTPYNVQSAVIVGVLVTAAIFIIQHVFMKSKENRS